MFKSTVSTEEQKIHGISIEAQIASLREYAKDNGLKVVGEYIDEGISARKPYTVRPELLRLLSDIEQKKIDTVLFVKLDRWFRSVKEYYKVQEILDNNGASWRATQEDYETETSAGRFKCNIMLAVAESEADRASERVRFVLDRKRAKGEPTGLIPYGYRTENKKPVIVPKEAECVRALFDKAASCVPRTELIHALPGRTLSYGGLRFILSNTAYIGERNDVPFPPIVDRDVFDKVQQIQKDRRMPKKTKADRVYLLSGLLYCPVCGSRLIGTPGDPHKKDNRQPLYYRCPKHSAGQGCTFNRRISETKAEQYLLSHINSNLQATVIGANKKEPKTYESERKSVKAKIKRLNDLYVDGNIDRKEYDRRKSALDAEYNAIPEDESEVDTEALQEHFFGGWEDLYAELSQKAKQTFWLQTVGRIELNSDGSFRDFTWKAAK